MDTILPTWSRPHSFWLLASDEVTITEPVPVFTFGLVVPELRTLSRPDGVARFGRQWGFGWLATLADNLPGATGRAKRSTLAGYLHANVGIGEPNTITDTRMFGEVSGASIPLELIDEFAATDGKRIRAWASNAFNMLDVTLSKHVMGKERVAQGHEEPARALLEAIGVLHRLTNVHDRAGRSRWAYVYGNLAERVALEFEDLAVRRPQVRLCRLCRRPFVPLSRGESFCAGNVWSADTRKLVYRCVPASEADAYADAESGEYRARYKAAWTKMRREIKTFGADSARGERALAAWERWRFENPSPAPPGRRRRLPETPEPPFTPAQ